MECIRPHLLRWALWNLSTKPWHSAWKISPTVLRGKQPLCRHHCISLLVLTAGFQYEISLSCPLSFEDVAFIDLHKFQWTLSQIRLEWVKIINPAAPFLPTSQRRVPALPAVLITKYEIFKWLQIASIKIVSISSKLRRLVCFDPMSFYVWYTFLIKKCTMIEKEKLWVIVT